jgi:predicted nucleic acid-binding protein
MTPAFVDTNVFVRFLTNDIPEKQRQAAALFNHVRQGQLQLTTPSSTIAEVVYVLHSRRLYNKSRGDVVNMLLPLIKLSGIKLSQRHVVIKALSLFESTTLSIGDAMIAASLLATHAKVLCSFDRDFDGIPGIDRLEPGMRVARQVD